MIKAYVQRLSQLAQHSKDIQQIAHRALRVVLEKHQALDKGIDASQRSLGTYKSKYYVEKHKAGNYHPINLKKEGDFRKSIKVNFDKKTPELQANDWKAEILKSKYGQGIVGISDEDLGSFIDKYTPEIQQEFNKLFWEY